MRHVALRLLFGVLLVCVAAAAHATAAHAAVGLTELPGLDGDGPVTVFYPAAGQPQTVQRGPFTLPLSWQAAPVRGNGRLVVISHGSGGNPWVHSDLARTLVADGFIVAMPEHRGDNRKDQSAPGPPSWERRPLEVSRAIDAVGRDPRFASLLRLDKVGMYGMSAGGHTALTLAGGRWSPAGFRRHCEAHIDDDFYACVGLATRRNGDAFDAVKKSAALWVIRWRMSDAAWRTHTDPRIAAIVASVPYASDFDLESLAKPRVPLALALARHDKWLVPRFHGDAVLRVCSTCERIVDLTDGGHGAYLSPSPPGLTGLVGELLNDPPGFSRDQLPAVDRKIAAFFRAKLL